MIACTARPTALLARTSLPRARRAGAVRAARGLTTVRAFKDEEVKTVAKDATSAAEAKLAEFVELAQRKWEESDNKPGIVAVGAGGVLALYFANAVVSTVDRIPLFNTLFELVGLGVSAWFAYRLIAIPGEKAKLTSSVKEFASKVGIDL